MSTTIDASSPAGPALPITCALPAPFGSDARDSQAAVISSLRSGNECRLIVALLLASRALSPAERLIAAWLPCIIGMDERARLRQPLPNTASILTFIRKNLRAMLARFPLDVRGRWLMPASDDDITAVYAATLLLAQQGTVARPWVWKSLPPTEGFMIIGTTRMRTRDPQHARCLGHATLLDLHRPTEALQPTGRRHSLSAVG